MLPVLTTQFTIFTNRKIEPTQDNITKYMEKLKSVTQFDFLPSVVISPRYNIATGKLDNLQNLTYTANDGYDQVVFDVNRIDYFCNFDIENQESFNDKIKLGPHILKMIMEEETPNIISNRLAFNITYLSNLCTGYTKFEKDVISLTPFYKDKNIKEWSNRTNTHVNKIINSNEEIINVISEFELKTNQVINETRIVCHNDINTIPENQEYRFTSKDVDEFFAEALNLYSLVEKDIVELVG